MCTGGRAGVRYVITKFSRMDSLPNFLTHGALLRARESSANNLEMKVIARTFAFRNISASEVRVNTFIDLRFVFLSSSLFSRFSWSVLFFGWSFSMLHFAEGGKRF